MTTTTQKIILENYSDKSFVVRGDTFPVKNELKSMGGRWNKFLKGGCGWIFSNKCRVEVEEWLVKRLRIEEGEKEKEKKIYQVLKDEDLRRIIFGNKSKSLKIEEMIKRQKHNYEIVVNSLMCIHDRLNMECEESYNNFTYGEKDEEAADYYDITHPIPMVDLMLYQECSEPDYICEECLMTFEEYTNIQCCCKRNLLPIHIDIVNYKRPLPPITFDDLPVYGKDYIY